MQNYKNKKIFSVLILLLLFFVSLFISPLSWQDELQAKIYKGKPQAWMLEQIREDLAPYRKVTQEALQKTLDLETGDLLLARYQIRGKEILMSHKTATPHRNMVEVHNYLKQLAEVIDLPKVDFVVCVHDAPPGIEYPVPVFAFAKQIGQKGVLFPDYEALGGHIGALRQVGKGKHKYPWKAKAAQAFWRGATSGTLFSSKSFLALPRTQAVLYSEKFPDLIDAKFTLLAQCADPEKTGALYPHFFSKNTSIHKHLQYKYQLLIDGNTCAYGRAYWQLFSECAILKQDSPNIQWYYRILKPYVHYLPVKPDLSDLPEKVSWLKDHDQEAYKMGQNAYMLAQANLKYSDIMYYVYLVLTEYAKLQE